jgi:AraC-like DNA-binding protein
MSGVTHSYREWPPSLAPRALLCVWAQRVAPGSGPYEHTSTPDGCVEIRGDDDSVPVVIGPRAEVATQTLAAGTTIVGAKLQPGTARTVLGVAASELVDTSVPLDHVWGPSVRGVGERIAEAASLQEAGIVLEAAISERLDEATAPDTVVQAAIDALDRENCGVVALAETLDISPRQLRRRCTDAVGFGPKRLQRILRFQRFLAAIHLGTGDDLARVAAELGYADQAHLTFECKRLSGHTPDILRTSIAQTCRHHDHRASLRLFRATNR